MRPFPGLPQPPRSAEQHRALLERAAFGLADRVTVSEGSDDGSPRLSQGVVVDIGEDADGICYLVDAGIGYGRFRRLREEQLSPASTAPG